MKDAVTVQRVLLLHPLFIDHVTGFIDELEAVTGRVWRVVQGIRTLAEQALIWAEGRTMPGPNVRPGHPLGDIVTYATAFQTYHFYGLAVDAVPFADASLIKLDWNYNYSIIRDIAIKHGLECGMDWAEPKTDKDHFEMRFGLVWEQMEAKYNAGDFIPNTKFIQIP